MMKLLGAALIVIAASSVGIRMSLSVRAEDRDLRQLQRVLEYMLCEIQGSLTPAQQLCERAGDLCRGQLRQLMQDCAAGIGAQEAADVGQIMEVCHLRVLCEILGKYDREEQSRAMENLIDRVADSIAQLQQGKADRCRSYEVLGVCAGCALAIILL